LELPTESTPVPSMPSYSLRSRASSRTCTLTICETRGCEHSRAARSLDSQPETSRSAFTPSPR
jgi:hypothetical protein